MLYLNYTKCLECNITFHQTFIVLPKKFACLLSCLLEYNANSELSIEVDSQQEIICYCGIPKY